jgi:hypothetical protein
MSVCLSVCVMWSIYIYIYVKQQQQTNANTLVCVAGWAGWAGLGCGVPATAGPLPPKPREPSQAKQRTLNGIAHCATFIVCVCNEPTTVGTWLILPVVICLSQRLSHACLSISLFIRRDCGWLIKSVIVYLMVSFVFFYLLG